MQMNLLQTKTYCTGVMHRCIRMAAWVFAALQIKQKESAEADNSGDDLSMVVSRMALNKIEELDFVLVADHGPFRLELVIGEVKRA